MDDDAQQLEAELKRLQLAPPSRRLWDNLESDLGRSRVRRRRAKVFWLWAGTLSAAAAVGLMIPLFGPGPVPLGNAVVATSDSVTAAHEVKFKPVSAENVLVSARDEGLVTLEDGTTARRERLHYIDTITWQNLRTNASLRWSVPREEVRVIPITVQ